MQFRIAMFAVCLAWVYASGCSTESLSKAVDQAKESVQQNLQKVGKEVENAVTSVQGKFELKTTGPLSVAGCYAKWNAFSDRPSVLMITSYPTVSAERFPSVMVRADTTSKTAAELAGQTLQAEVYVMEAAAGPVWQSPRGAKVELKVLQAADGQFSGEFVQGTIVNVATGEQANISGQFSGELK